MKSLPAPGERLEDLDLRPGGELHLAEVEAVAFRSLVAALRIVVGPAQPTTAQVVAVADQIVPGPLRGNGDMIHGDAVDSHRVRLFGTPSRLGNRSSGSALGDRGCQTGRVGDAHPERRVVPEPDDAGDPRPEGDAQARLVVGAERQAVVGEAEA